MKVLYISVRQSYPPVSGAKLRDFHLARAFGKQGALSYVFYADPGSAVSLSDFPFCKELVLVPRPRMYTPGKIAEAFFRNAPLPVINYTSAEMLRQVRDLYRSNSYDLVYFDSIHLMGVQAAIQNGKAMVVYNWHNIESELMQRYSRGDAPLAKRIYAAYTAKLLARAETRILEQADAHIVCSEREKQMLLQLHPGLRPGLRGPASGTP